MGNPWVGNYAKVPPSCSYNGKMHYNEGAGTTRADLQPICRTQFDIEVDEDGNIIDGGAKFSVSWVDGMAAPPGSHLVGARENTIFVIGGNTSFTNPPVFLKSSTQVNAEAAVLNEVNIFLDHLFHHDNTPVFIVKRLIQRFTSSNPSGGYVQAVAEAFRTGTFNGTVYGGKYGDLAATVAAILLHPDARQTGAHGGALREPILKILHLLRAMEYQDLYGSPVIIKDLQDVIGQFPFSAPSVFNFYQADYELPVLPESEPEPEVESDAQSSLVLAPEFDIFTPKYFAGYLNVMMAIISWGVSGECSSETFAGVSVLWPEDGIYHQICPQGSLKWNSAEPDLKWNSAEADESVLDDLNLLLTGGRLSAQSQATVRQAYTDGVVGQQVKSALGALIMTPEFNTLGEPLPLTTTLRDETSASEIQRTQPYKAAVFMWMAGGADTWNMLVPQECDLYQEYVDHRTDIALTPAELLQITTSGQNCSKFGIHQSLGFLKQLYDAGEASFVTNIGGLVKPTTMQDLNRGGQRCATGTSLSALFRAPHWGMGVDWCVRACGRVRGEERQEGRGW